MAAAVGLVDALYAAAGVAGAAPLLQIGALELVLGLLGAGVLVFLGTRTLYSAFRVRLGGETDEEIATPRRAFATAFAATASNPLTIASWAAVFAATTTAGATDTGASTVALLVGVGLGSLGWYVVLSCAVALARRHIGDSLVRTVDVIAGAGLVAFGGLLAARSVSES
jgi:putative LysE/RhtB family amino acid efflux pump